MIGRRRLAIGGAAALLAGSLPRVARSGEPPIPVLPLAIAVADSASDAGAEPAQTEAWIDAQIAEAQRLFGGQGLRLIKADTRRIPAAHARLETRKDRDALAALLRPDVINVFVVSALRDVDEKDRYRMGVCWSPRGDRASRFVVVSSIARPSVLAHELGHYFGNPHSRVVNNVMSYDHDEGVAPFFDEGQGRVLRETARAYLRDGILKGKGP